MAKKRPKLTKPFLAAMEQLRSCDVDGLIFELQQLRLLKGKPKVVEWNRRVMVYCAAKLLAELVDAREFTDPDMPE